jgi:hypothetical protein
MRTSRKAGESPRMLGSKDRFHEIAGFRKCATKLGMQSPLLEDSGSEAVRVKIVAYVVAELGAIWEEKEIILVKHHLLAGIFEIDFEITEETFRYQQGLRWRR